MKLHITIDLSGFAPVVRLLRGFFASRAARVVRLHFSQLHPLAPTRYHRRCALLLANLETRTNR